jgi:predicted amidohydrolase YtcJ
VADEGHDGGLSRRELLKGAAAGAALVAGGGSALAAAKPANASGGNRAGCAGSRDVLLTNGRFYDGRGFVTKEMTIKDGRIFSLDKQRTALGACTTAINLKNRVVIPGLIDAHVHFTRTGTNLGYETRWIESAFSIAELQQVIADRAKTVPEGPDRFITAQGGWAAAQFEENRLPTKAELDAATTKHGVYLNGRTNSVGAAFFAGFGVTVDAVTGQVSSTTGATNALRSIQTFEDKVRGTADAIRFCCENGLTSMHDTSNLNVQPDDYAVMNTLYHRNGRQLDVRMRHYRYFDTDAHQSTLEQLVRYMDPIFRGAGDDTYRILGVGEQIGPGSLNPLSPTLVTQYIDLLRAVARAGWSYQQHYPGGASTNKHVEDLIAVGHEFDLRPLRWSYAHVGVLTPAQLAGLKEVGMGATITRGPVRDTLASGIQLGLATDATNVAPVSPWVELFYATTGRLQRDVHEDHGSAEPQAIDRLTALRLYTLGSAWFSHEDDQLGSFEVGKLADLAVLSDDYFTVMEHMIPKLRSVLTMQGGRVVHAAAPFADLAP